MQKTRILGLVFATAALSLGGTIAATAGSSDVSEGEATSTHAEVIVVGESHSVNEATLTRDWKIARALEVSEPTLGPSSVARAAADAGLDRYRLIEMRNDKDAGGQAREDALFRVDDGSVIEVWWQRIDPAWDLDINAIAAVSEGKPLEVADGLVGQITDQGKFVHAMVTDGAILVSVLSSTGSGRQGSDGSLLTTSEAEDLLLRLYSSLKP